MRVPILVGFFVTQNLCAKPLPKNLQWQTQDAVLPNIADPQAKEGGTMNIRLSSFPLTLRTVGPGANTVLYPYLLDNNWGLTTIHPNTGQVVGLLASEWAEGVNGRTMYYKLNKAAKWSDGKPVTAQDFVFTVELMRSKHIQDPWYNRYYTEEIESVVAYDNYTLSITMKQVRPDLLLHADIAPYPKHFFRALGKDFVVSYNWRFVPNTGPYYIDEKDVKNGESVTFTRKKNWWARKIEFFKNRFNVDRISFKVVGDNSEWEQFKKQEFDTFQMNDPMFWYEKSNVDLFLKGYIHKLWFYNDQPRPCAGLWLNTNAPLLKDERLRKAVAHATNFDKVIAALFNGEAVRMNTCTDGYGDYTNHAVKATPFSLDSANRLFKETGWDTRDGEGIRVKDGARLEINLLYVSEDETPTLRMLADEMKRAGIKMKLELTDWATMLKQMDSGKHQIAFTGVPAQSSGVPEFSQVWHGANANVAHSNNFSNVNDSTLNELIDNYGKSTDKGQRVKFAHDIDARIHELGVFIPGYSFPFFRQAYWRWWRLPKIPATNLSDDAFTPFAPSYGGLFWLDETLKAETQQAMTKNRAFPPVTLTDRTYEPKTQN
ncbi:MAG: extracellular solute-binding protein [Oligoflexales bacterium]